MRSVVIVHDRANKRPWGAIDRKSGSPVLRFQDRDQLKGVCTRLGWDIAVQEPERGAKAAERASSAR